MILGRRLEPQAMRVEEGREGSRLGRHMDNLVPNDLVQVDLVVSDG